MMWNINEKIVKCLIYFKTTRYSNLLTELKIRNRMTALPYNNSHAIITISWQFNKLALGQTYTLKEYSKNIKIQRKKLNTFMAYKLHNPILF